MKILWMLLQIISMSPAFGYSIVPDRIVTPLVDIFSEKNKETPAGWQVRVTTYNEKGTLKKNGGTLDVTKEQYQALRESAGAVYRMQGKDWSGTAFHIGHNLVLTNFHVVDKERKRVSCDNFQLWERSEDKFFDCKKVHFCNNAHDVCLVEMLPIKKKHGCFFCKKEISWVSLADGPKLSLKYDNDDLSSDSILTAVGNSFGYGIHVSQGRGALKSQGAVYFYAPIRSGNSGGALINEEGEVVGVVRAESKDTKVGNDTNDVFNLATSTDKVVDLIREGLANDQDTLDKFNEAVLQ